MTTNKIKTFRAFLKTYLEEDCWLGDLARDSFSTSSYWTGTTVSSLRRHMKNLGCCNEALEALATVAKLYKQSQQIHSQPTSKTAQS
jgi:hypothetical protein